MGGTRVTGEVSRNWPYQPAPGDSSAPLLVHTALPQAQAQGEVGDCGELKVGQAEERGRVREKFGLEVGFELVEVQAGGGVQAEQEGGICAEGGEGEGKIWTGSMVTGFGAEMGIGAEIGIGIGAGAAGAEAGGGRGLGAGRGTGFPGRAAAVSGAAGMMGGCDRECEFAP